MRKEHSNNGRLRIIQVCAVALLLAATGYLSVTESSQRKGTRASIALRIIGQALHIYSQKDVYNPHYPEHLGELLEEQYLEGYDLVCRGSATDVPSTGAEVAAGQTDFIYIHRPIEQYESDDPIVFTKPPSQGTFHNSVWTDQISVLYADLKTIKRYDELPEQLKQHVSDSQKANYSEPSIIENLSDIFRPPTFFAIIAGIAAYFILSWCYTSKMKIAAALGDFLPIAIPVILVPVLCGASSFARYIGHFRYIGKAYQTLLHLVVTLSGIALLTLIIAKDRRSRVRILSLIVLILYLLFTIILGYDFVELIPRAL